MLSHLAMKLYYVRLDTEQLAAEETELTKYQDDYDDDHDHDDDYDEDDDDDDDNDDDDDDDYYDDDDDELMINSYLLGS